MEWVSNGKRDRSRTVRAQPPDSLIGDEPRFRFDERVNTSEASAAYTSLLAVDDNTVVVTHDKRLPNATAAFAMRLTLG